MILICLLANVLIAAYFASKKWKFVSLLYFFAIGVMATLALFFVDNPFVVSLLCRIFGEQFYELVVYTFDDSAVMLSPYLGVMVMTLILSVVVSITASEKIITSILKNNGFVFNRNNGNDYVYVIDNRRIKSDGDIYLINCALLC